jgi:hypothetical protein
MIETTATTHREEKGLTFTAVLRASVTRTRMVFATTETGVLALLRENGSMEMAVRHLRDPVYLLRIRTEMVFLTTRTTAPIPIGGRGSMAMAVH